MFAAFAEPSQRGRWLPGVELATRSAQPPRSARFDWEDGRTRVNVHFGAKGEAKTATSVEHERLADADEAERMKAFWRARLGELKRLLEA